MKKCIGLLYGNHEWAYIKRHNFNTITYICNNLKTISLYDKAVIIFNDNIKLLISHGTGGGGGAEG